MQNIEPSLIHIAVVVILKDDRVLIAKRSKQAHQGGLWEFPGGKVEAGESVASACSREIHEELGISILQSRSLIKISHHYEDKSVLLETILCRQFSGKEYQQEENLSGKQQFGLEGQRVKWVPLNQLNHYDFPEANKAIINALKLPDKYLISPDYLSHDYRQVEKENFMRQFLENCAKYSMIQLRFKSLEGSRLRNVLQACSCIAQKKDITLFINSATIDIKDETLNYDGLHLTSDHLYDIDFINRYRQYYPQRMISASCHTIEDIEQANFQQLDFILLSPVQKTQSHPHQDALGWEKFARLCALANMPCFALGGMVAGDISLAQKNGAQGIAAISGLWKTREKGFAGQ